MPTHSIISSEESKILTATLNIWIGYLKKKVLCKLASMFRMLPGWDSPFILFLSNVILPPSSSNSTAQLSPHSLLSEDEKYTSSFPSKI